MALRRGVDTKTHSVMTLNYFEFSGVRCAKCELRDDINILLFTGGNEKSASQALPIQNLAAFFIFQSVFKRESLRPSPFASPEMMRSWDTLELASPHLQELMQ